MKILVACPALLLLRLLGGSSYRGNPSVEGDTNLDSRCEQIRNCPARVQAPRLSGVAFWKNDYVGFSRKITP